MDYQLIAAPREHHSWGTSSHQHCLSLQVTAGFAIMAASNAMPKRFENLTEHERELACTIVTLKRRMNHFQTDTEILKSHQVTRSNALLKDLLQVVDFLRPV